VAFVSLVIPAHNEERMIRRLLDGLRGLADDAEVVVVCNGCTDETATVAREVAPWAHTVETTRASKPTALRLGDSVVTTTPRLYLDADVVLTADGVRRLAAVLESEPLEAVAPTPRYDVSAAGWLVRSHYRLWTALQLRNSAISGTGAIMISARGRERFGDWPDVIADDYFLDGLFSPSEKRRVTSVDVAVALPRTFRDCVSRRARVHSGNRDVVRAGLRTSHREAARPRRLLVELLRAQPSMAVHLPAHLAVTISTRAVSSWRQWRGTTSVFFRDSSTRECQ
jgi:glycosyltransferase involved in cell wall biosynthesis